MRGPNPRRKGESEAFWTPPQHTRGEIEAAYGAALPDDAWRRLNFALLAFGGELADADLHSETEHNHNIDEMGRHIEAALRSIAKVIHADKGNRELARIHDDLQRQLARYGPRAESKSPVAARDVSSPAQAKVNAVARLDEICRAHDLCLKKLTLACKIHPHQSDSAWSKWFSRTKLQAGLG